MGTVSFGSTACGGSGTSGKALVSLSETTAHPAGYPAFAGKGRMLITPTVLAQYRVGERVLLTVATQNGFSDAATATADPDPTRIVQAIDAQIARLKAKGLG